MREGLTRRGVGRLLGAWLGGLLVLATLQAAEETDRYWVYFGTSGKGSAIYRSLFDAKTGQLGEAEFAAEVRNPSFLAIHPSRKFLYAVGDLGGKAGLKGGGVHAFAIEAATGRLTPLNSAPSRGAGPCHVVVNPAGTMLIVANYTGGSTILYKLESDGKIGAEAGFVTHGAGAKVNATRQEAAHAHCGAFAHDGRFAISVDLGMDKLKVFRVEDSGEVNDAAAEDIPLPPGSGPRHIAIAPDQKVAYVNGELDSTVNVVELDLAGGKSRVIQSLSTLPQPTPGNTTAEVILSQDGRFVYVSNRGHNSVAVFKVGPDRKLTAVGHITGDINIPRNFNIDPSGRWMLIGSQATGKVGVWQIDAESGLAKETGQSIRVPSPICVRFVPVAK